MGVDEDDGRYACHAKWETGESPEALNPGLRLIDPDTRAIDIGPLKLTRHAYGNGAGVYLGSFAYSPEAAKALLRLLVELTGADAAQIPACDQPSVETAWFPASKTLVVLNNAKTEVAALIKGLDCGELTLEPFEMRFVTA